MIIASPPTISPCFYGVDTPNKENLIASHMSVQEIADMIGVDSLHYISTNGLYKAILEQDRDSENPQYCDACFSNDYPIRLVDKDGQETPLFDFMKS